MLEHMTDSLAVVIVCMCQQSGTLCRMRPAATVSRVTSSAQSQSITDVVILQKITLCLLAGPSFPFGMFPCDVNRGSLPEHKTL